MNCIVLSCPFTYIVEISCPAILAKILAETNIFRKIRKLILKMFSVQVLGILNVPDVIFISLPDKVRILHGSHENFSILGIKPDSITVSWTNFDLREPLHSFIQYLFRRPENRLFWQHWVSNIWLIAYLTTFVKIKGALVIPNGKTVKTKKFFLPLITQEKPKNVWWDSKISNDDKCALD